MFLSRAGNYLPIQAPRHRALSNLPLRHLLRSGIGNGLHS